MLDNIFKAYKYRLVIYIYMYPCGYGYFPSNIANKGYVLEVIRKINGTYIHIGYLNKKFNSKQDACDFYAERFPHMRKINVLVSDLERVDKEAVRSFNLSGSTDTGIHSVLPQFTKLTAK